MKITRILPAAVAAGALAAVPLVAAAGSGSGHQASYRVTVENIAGGFQPLSPAAVVVHGGNTDVWSVGAPATAAVAAAAEDANLGVFVDTYDDASGVSDAFVGGTAPFGPGMSSEFEFEARRGDRVSFVSMLVNTKDAFTGLDSVQLGNGTQVIEVGAYDAGTEMNDELGMHIPGPAGDSPFMRAPEGALISHHPGVTGVGDLDPAFHGWGDGPVARITIERID